MKLSKMIKIEIWKIIQSKKAMMFIVIEVIAIFLSQLDAEELFTLDNMSISPFIGISLTFRYTYLAIAVSYFFSKDIEDSIIDTYIAIGVKRKKIWLAKEICLIVIAIANTVISTSIYSLSAIMLKKVYSISDILDFFVITLFTIIPIVIHILVLTIIDIIFESPLGTILAAISMIMISGLLPYDFSKWLYSSYNNPYLLLYSKDYSEIGRMIFVYLLSYSLCLIMIYFTIDSIGDKR